MKKIATKPYTLYNEDSTSLKAVKAESLHALITDPPYGISYQNNAWDKNLPNPQIWKNSLDKLKPGAFGAVFSSVRLMHRMMVNLEDSGFLIKDVLFWAYLNGMPKSRDVALDIDKELDVKSKKIGSYKYVQGYKKDGSPSYKVGASKDKLSPASDQGQRYLGSGLGIKPAYEPIILVQKPLSVGMTVAQNIITHGTGALNFEATRIPYEEGESKVGHNPHPRGRVPANIIRTEAFDDGYDKFFLVPKVRQHAEDFNHHPTLKPLALMDHLVKLLTWEEQLILDPFMGSGSTGVSAVELNRQFIGYEMDKDYFEIAKKRVKGATSSK